MSKPQVNSKGQQELDKAQEQFEKFDEQVKSMSFDKLNAAPKQETEQQTKLSDRQQQKIDGIYLKPIRTIGCRDKFNEAFRDKYNFDKEYVKFIAENSEIIGEAIDLWTRPFGGMSAEEWKVPVNTPVWGPRYLAEQIKRKAYTRLRMDESRQASADGAATYYGQMVAETRIQRLDARPVKDSVTVGFASSF
jgi:hypothetical protein